MGRVLMNAAMLAAVKWSAPVASFLLVAVVSRRLGPEGLGRYSLAYVYLAVFSLPGGIGLPTLLTRDGLRNRAGLGRLLSTALTLVTLAGAPLTMVMLAADPEGFGPVSVLSFALVPALWLVCLDAAWLAVERSGPIALASTLEHVFKVGLGLALLPAGGDLSVMVFAAVLGKLAACLMSLWLLRRFGVLPEAKVSAGDLRALAARTPVFALSAGCASLHRRVDVLVLSRLRSVAEVGHYGAALRILELAILLPQSLCQARFPGIAAGKRNDGDLPWLAASSIPIAVALGLTSQPLIRAIYGAELSGAAPALAILIWNVVPYAWTRYQACLLVAAGRQGTDLAVNLGGLAAVAVLNLALVPHYGANGAAAAAVLAGFLQAAAQSAILRRLRAKPIWSPSPIS